MKDVIITDEEIQFMKRRCIFLPLWYFTFLRGFRFNPSELTVSQDAALEEARSREKSAKIFGAGLTFGDMGTRRRFSFAHHDMVVRTMKETYDSRQWPGKFTGTSNVWFAMKYDCAALGTMSHQLISFEENVTGAEPMNIVVKLTRGRITESREWHDCVKLSCNLGKTLGSKEKCDYLIRLLNHQD